MLSAAMIASITAIIRIEVDRPLMGGYTSPMDADTAEFEAGWDYADEIELAEDPTGVDCWERYEGPENYEPSPYDGTFSES